MSARILVVEDNPSNLDLMCYLLGAFGHAALVARDGAAGLEAVRRERPDLVLCDIHLPGPDGLELARRVRADPDLRATRLVAVTALAMVGDRERVLAAGFDGYVAKPIDPETFVGLVDSFLPAGRRSPARRPPTVLVVDNVAANRELARSLLEPHGYRVVTAEGPADALAAARAAPPDLILSDVCMQQGNGFDFLRAVKADERLRALPFLFLTSTFDSPADRERGLALGADRYLVRPLDPQALLAEVEACLRGGREGG